MSKFKRITGVAVALCMASCVGFSAACSPSSDTGTEGEGVYTYRLATSSLPNSWNVHTYTSASSQDAVLTYTESGLYTFDYNDTLDGYEIVPAMAASDPVDVSSEYVGSAWNITSDDEWRAIRISLRHDLKYDNGDDITAQDFVDSMRLLLNPDAANYRADTYYGGQFTIMGAENYVKSGTYAYTSMVSANYGDEEYFDIEDTTTSTDGTLQYTASDGTVQDLVLNIYSGGNWGSNGLYDYYAYGYLEGFDDITTLLEAADEDGYVTLTASLLDILMDAIAILHGYDNADAYAAEVGAYVGADGDINYAYAEWEEMCYFGAVWAEYSFDNVGIKAVDDYTLDIILESSLSGFYLLYNLTGALSLVHVETYEACMSTSQGAYSNSYGTSMSTYVGFGPYKISSYVQDSIITFERNPYWYGYNDEGYTSGEQYQTTNISIQQITSEATRLNEFLAGNLDSYGLSSSDLATYQSSEYVYFTEGDSTWFVALNPDYEGLLSAQESATSTSGRTVNKTVLTLTSFRQALSYSINRQQYISTLDPLGTPALALFGNMIVSDPDNGTAYRTTDEAKQAIVNYWGYADDIGEGKTYATIDDAIEAITASGGYDITSARQLFTQAYEEAVASGLLPEGDNWEVQIVIGKPSEAAYYNNGYEFLQATWTEAVVGTPFEGHLVFSQSETLGSTSFAEALQNNTVDVLFGVGWTGSALDPYSLMEVYVSPNYQYDPGWDTTTTPLDITLTIDGVTKTYRASVYDWGYTCLQGGTISASVLDDDGNITTESATISAGTDADSSVRLAILAAVEEAVLLQYDMIPISLEASASLKGMRIQFYTEEYIYGVGRGGIQYLTYTMDDAEWAAYVRSQGGTLNYT